MSIVKRDGDPAPAPRAVGKFVAIAAPSETFVVVLDDQGQIWARFQRPNGAWEWNYVEPPEVAAPQITWEGKKDGSPLIAQPQGSVKLEEKA